MNDLLICFQSQNGVALLFLRIQDAAAVCRRKDSCISVLMAVLVIIAKNGIGLDGFQLMDG